MLKFVRLAPFVILAVPWNVQAELTPGGVFRTAAPSVVVVEVVTRDGASVQGSGVVIETEEVVTNCHVVSNHHEINVISLGARTSATVRYADRARDLCQLSVEGLNAVPARQRSASSLEVGERVFSIGAPRGLNLTISEGIVSSAISGRAVDLIQTSAAISPGSSGGGLFDDSGALVGITTLYLRDSQSLNFAVPSDWIGEIAVRASGSGSQIEDSAALNNDDAVRSARAELDALEGFLRRTSPIYEDVKDEFYRRVALEAGSLPPEEWREAALTIYREIESAHSTSVVRDDRWLEVASADDATHFLDTQSMIVRGGVVEAWTMVEYFTPAMLDGVAVHSFRNFDQYDCGARSFRNRQYVTYGDSERVLSVRNYPSVQGFQPVIPGSVGESLLVAVCSKMQGM